MIPTNCFNPTTIDEDIGSEDGLDSGAQGDAEAVALWFHTRDTYLAYHDKLGRHSWDDDDDEIVVYAHAGGSNAGYAHTCGMEFSDNFVALDVVAHEFSHGVVAHTSDLVYQGQSGALDEAFADSMAALIADTSDWLLGEGLLNGGGPLRSLSDPLNGQCRPAGGGAASACNNPDRWSLRLSFTTSTDNGNVHSNSGIQNKATFLMSDGGIFNGRSVVGMGRTKTARVIYSVMRFLSPQMATFNDARNYAVGAAAGFAAGGQHGFTAADVCTVRNAYAAVEIGLGDVDCDGIEDNSEDTDADGILDVSDNCPFVPNPSQFDFDNNGTGDACDVDSDNDGIVNDNCPQLATSFADNVDFDFDGLGKACDPDDDNDGIPDNGAPGNVPCVSGQTVGCDDNCPDHANPTQADGNANGFGDACDPDQDGDGFYADTDNCTFVPNPDQADADMDGFGDACDDCPNDEDQIFAYTPGIPELGIPPQPYQPDSDGDGIPDACDDYAFAAVRVNVGLQLYDPGDPPRPDGAQRQMQIVGPAGGVAQLVFEPCDPADGDGYAAGEYVQITFTGLDLSVQPAIVDDWGRELDRSVRIRPAGAGPDRGFRFKPVCDHRYFLHFELGTAFPGTDAFTLRSDVVPGGGGIADPWASLGEALLPPPGPLPDTDGDGTYDSTDTCPATFDADQADFDVDEIGNACDNCAFFASADQNDVDADGRGNVCECTDQDGDGRNTVSDLVAINLAIFNPALVGPLCDGNNDGRCDVSDIIAANVEIFSPGFTSTCARQPVAGRRVPPP